MLLTLVYRAISWIASIVIAFSNVGALAEKPNAPAWDKNAFHSSIDKGNLRFSPKWEITYDDVLLDAFADLEQRTGFNIPEASSALKDMYWTHRWMVKLFPGIFYGLRDRWLAKGDEFAQQDDGVRMVLYRILGLCVGMPTKVHIEARPIAWWEPAPPAPLPAEEADEPAAEEAGGPVAEVSDIPPYGITVAPGDAYEYDIYIKCFYADGKDRSIFTFSKYNKFTGEFGEDNGVGGLSYNFNFKDAFAYTTNNSWQRALGYMKLYDTLLLQTTDMVNIDTVRLKFDYAGRDWMLQLWKGRYFTTTGGEIGLYNKPKDRRIEFYDCATDEERINMSFRITTDDTTIDDPVLIDRPVMPRWWFTGFAVRQRLYKPDRLTLGAIVVPTDAAMYTALKGALDREKVPYDAITWPGNDENGWVPMAAFEITWK